MANLLTTWEPLDYTIESIRESKQINDGKVIVKGILQKADALNQNMRIYPRHILEREVRNYQKFIVENRSLGECVPPGTEILTKDGWRDIKDVKVSDNVATLNLETNEIEYQDVTHKIEKDFSGNLLNIKNNSTINMMVTPNHRVLFWNRKNKSEFMLASEFKKLVDEKSSHISHSSFKRTGNWIGKDDEFIEIPGFGNVKTELWAAFLGIYLAEGSTSGTRSIKHSNSVGICQSKNAHPIIFQEIKTLLLDIGFNFKESDNDFTLSKMGDEFHSFMHNLGNSHTKYIPQYAKDWSPRLLEILLTWMLKGDGRNRHGRNGELINEYSTVSKQLADDVCEIMIKLGNGASIRFTKRYDRPAPDFKVTGRMILAENSSLLYTVYRHKSKGASLSTKFLKITEIPYQGKVYCVTVPNGTWLMKYKDKTFWTMNCDHPTESIISLKNVSHIIREAYFEGDVVMGKVEILNTPSGKILQSLVESGVKLGISSRGVGSTQKQGDYFVVQDDFMLICWDFVSEPSTPGAFMLAEGKALNSNELSSVFNKSDKINRIVNDILLLKK